MNCKKRLLSRFFPLHFLIKEQLMTTEKQKEEINLAKKFATLYAQIHPADVADELENCSLEEQIQFLLRQKRMMLPKQLRKWIGRIKLNF